MGDLHEAIVTRACRHEGWHRGDWKTAFVKKCEETPMWAGEIETEDNGRELWGDMRRNPDAWRIVAEGPDTPGKDWSYPVLILEFLEVEISHPLSLDKRTDYTALWWRFDGTSSFHFRVYRAERYGPIAVWLDTETIYYEMLP